MCFVPGHYTDIDSLLGGRVGGVRELQSIVDDDGHCSDIPGDDVRRRSSFYEHNVNIDRVAAASGDGVHPTTGPGKFSCVILDVRCLLEPRSTTPQATPDSSFWNIWNSLPKTLRLTGINSSAGF